MTPAKRNELFTRLREANPTPATELMHGNPFELLVAVVLSAQSTDRGVNKVTAELFPLAPTPAAMAALGIERVETLIGSLGLFRNKARNVVALSKMLVHDHGGEVPKDRDALERLPGVGRKTANVVLNTAFGQPTIAVDTHIFRVANRTRLAPGKDVLAVERALEALVPPEFVHNAHHWLILHGRYVCTARAPKCETCAIVDVCEYPEKNLSRPPAAKRRIVPERPAPAARSRAPARGVHPMAKTARAGTRRGRAR